MEISDPPHIKSFDPVTDSGARLLILGSMPGEASLRAGQYYAQPRNQFWKIMGALIGAGPDLDYQARLQKLKDHRIALWDVLHSCRRTGSLDSAIADERANDFPAFFARHLHITHVFFNGVKAMQSFRCHAMPFLQGRDLRYTRLPSTSPAHASMSYEQKLAEWQAIYFLTQSAQREMKITNRTASS